LLSLLATVLLAAAVTTGDAPALEAKTFEITASKFKFEPGTIEVNEGDHVVLKIHSADTVHGLAVKEFKARVKVPKTGQEVTLEFVADKPGTFKISCSEYCGGGHSGMKGVLIVHPRAK
jgi:cytochrome c oxidase subunit 2